MLSGFNNKIIKTSTKITIINLILSEIIFFITFFYINYSNLIFNNINQNIKYFNKIYKLNTIMAFLNLIILLTSRITIIIFININKKLITKSNKIITKTILLRIYFLIIQNIEYKNINFNPNNSIIIRNFFTLTIFHIIHVILGTICIILFLTIKIKIINIKTKFIATC